MSRGQLAHSCMQLASILPLLHVCECCLSRLLDLLKLDDKGWHPVKTWTLPLQLTPHHRREQLLSTSLCMAGISRSSKQAAFGRYSSKQLSKAFAGHAKQKLLATPYHRQQQHLRIVHASCTQANLQSGAALLQLLQVSLRLLFKLVQSDLSVILTQKPVNQVRDVCDPCTLPARDRAAELQSCRENSSICPGVWCWWASSCSCAACMKHSDRSNIYDQTTAVISCMSMH